ncbi:MAG: LruC domain-containing protein [Bacteroidia bacterium]
MLRILTSLLIAVIVLSFSSCKPDWEDLDVDYNNFNVADLPVPDDFDFATDKKITVTINDDADPKTAKYLVYSVDGQEETLVATSIANGKSMNIDLSIPDFIETVKIVKQTGEGETEEYLKVDGPTAEGSFNNGVGGSSGCHEHLYAVNGDGQFYKIDVEDNSYTANKLPDLIGGTSYACAVNKDLGIVYYNTHKTLRYYDYNSETFHILGTGNPFNGHYARMEYNHDNGLLYIGERDKMYTIDPTNNQVQSSFTVVGLESPNQGGDLAISKDGTIFLSCFSGLYRLRVSSDTAYATRISAENLPFSPTSMAIDRNDRLYLATSEGKSRLIEMDKVDGAWSVVKTYNHRVNDLGSYKCDVSQLSNIDSDGDGVIDQLDDFPEDSAAASAVYTPSELGWGTLAFEDLWPSKGDYDFNDMVVKYRFTQVENAQGEVVRIESRFQVKAIGASFHNGLGFKMDVDPDLISSVTGSSITDNLVTLNAKGLEEGHNDGSVVIVFDDAFDNLGGNPGGTFVNTLASSNEIIAPELLITINFTNPINPALVGDAPFNPFIFINADRGRELHLADHESTDLVNTQYFGTSHDATVPSLDRFYRTTNNLTWGINIVHEFRQPLEKQPINTAYNYFNTWAISGGSNFKDWYKDNAGYRNRNKLFIK